MSEHGWIEEQSFTPNDVARYRAPSDERRAKRRKPTKHERLGIPQSLTPERPWPPTPGPDGHCCPLHARLWVEGRPGQPETDPEGFERCSWPGCLVVATRASGAIRSHERANVHVIEVGTADPHQLASWSKHFFCEVER